MLSKASKDIIAAFLSSDCTIQISQEEKGALMRCILMYIAYYEDRIKTAKEFSVINQEEFTEEVEVLKSFINKINFE